MPRPLAALLGLLALAPLLPPARASACTIVCTASLQPRGSRMVPARLPVNGAFVSATQSSWMGPLAGTLTIVRTRAGVETTSSAPVSTMATLLADAQVDDRYAITLTGACATAETFVHVMPEAPLPTTLGVLEVGASHVEDVEVGDDRGSCTSPISSAVARYTFAVDPSWAEWADALVLTPVLDGAPIDESPGLGVWTHPGLIAAHCVAPLPSQSVLDTTPGEHVLRMVGSIRGFDSAIASNDVTFELTCSGGSAGCSVSPSDRSSPGSWLVAMGLALALTRRRRAYSR